MTTSLNPPPSTAPGPDAAVPGRPPSPPHWGPPPVPPAPPRPPADRPRRRVAAGLAGLAVMAAAIGGGVGGLVGYESASPPAPGVLTQPVPPAGATAAGPVAQVATAVLPSVVQLQGPAGEGSGVVISADGLILTNAHVLAAAGGGGLTAVLHDGTRAPVDVVGADPSADLAVVRARGQSGLTPIQRGNSDGLQVGQQVVAVGSPLGLSGTVTSGIISALDRPVTAGGAGGGQPTALDAIQTDAAINPGNSGGPLVDMQGRMIGINSAIATVGSAGGPGGSIGLGFAIPVNQAVRIADQLVGTGHATRAVLGVSLRDAAPTGAELASVAPGSPAAQAGLAAGDVVTAIDGRPIENAAALAAAVNSRPPGSTVALTVGGGRTVPVTLGTAAAG